MAAINYEEPSLQSANKTGVKKCKKFYWYDLELDNAWYMRHLYGMYGQLKSTLPSTSASLMLNDLLNMFVVFLGDDLNVPTLKSCLKASMIRNIDGIIKGKDGIPLKPRRRVQISDKEVDALE
ncbi:hypothetical protein Tco_0522740 [Tanacetum coccineum]